MPVSAYDSILRRGLGLGAKEIGTRFNVYRLNQTSTGSLVNPSNLVISNYAARMQFHPPKFLLEQTDTYTMWYTGICDTRALRIGDVMVEVNPQLTDTPDGRAFCLVDVQPLQGPVFARVEVAGSMSRPNNASMVAEVTLGDGGYQGTEKYTEWIYTLSNGFYYVSATGIPATIPMGLQNHRRPGPAQPIKNPTATPRGVYYAYVPLLPGIQIHPGDFISDQNGNRYRVEVATVFTSGLQGWQLIINTVFV